MDANHPSIPAAVAHEAWHRLWIDHRRDAEMIGEMIKGQLSSGLMEAAKIPHLRNYGDEMAEQEVGANIFVSIITDPIFWKEYSTPSSAEIAEAIRETATIPAYREARLVRNW